ncbi:MAG: GNAT family N-acetyltransferase [Planctomycetes bacterium]|nr:GNAT family N-acetyltransferase [Planctomycetota bacterium]
MRSTCPTSWHVSELNDIAELRAFGPLWGHLMERTPVPSYVQSLEFLRAFWSVVGAGRRLRVVLAHENAEVVNAWPLATVAPHGSITGLRWLTHATPEFAIWSGAVGAPSITAIKAALQYLTGSVRDWDVLELFSRSKDVSEPSALDAAFRAAGLRATHVPLGFVAFVDCRGDHRSYWKQRPISYRRRLAQCTEQLQGHARLRYLRARSGEPGDEPLRSADGWLAVCRDLIAGQEGTGGRSAVARRANGKRQLTVGSDRDAGSGLAASNRQTVTEDIGQRYRPIVQPPFRLVAELHETASNDRAVDWNVLTLDDRAAAFVYSYVWNGHVQVVCSGQRSGPDGQAAMALLIARMIEDSFRRGDQSVHLGPGLFGAAQGAQTTTLLLSRWVFCSRRTFRGRVARLKLRPKKTMVGSMVLEGTREVGYGLELDREQE